jgi:putative FmdB family regulatory protein
MPIYEYRCTSCGHQQEFLQKVSDAPVTVCTQCGKPTFSKMLTAAGFQLKGSGWYATDFKNGGKAKPATDSSKIVPPKGDSSDAKSESKPESKGDSPSTPAAESKPATETKSGGASKDAAPGA